ncbi:MAG: DUF1922 domain-containing protein, partial [Planctomycetes bacterium]|nr:DUF1922 domain-containing protein [Planctomycetota bacterium]
MARYLVRCECGANVPVEAGQAGRRVACPCGLAIDVPPLRLLRHLPQEAAGPTRSAATWGARQGILTLCLLVTSVLAAFTAWSWWTEPMLPKFNPEVQAAQMERQIDALTPRQAWQLWAYEYRPLAESGFAQLSNPLEPAIRAEIDRRRLLRRVMLVVAGLFAAGAVVATFWPRASTSPR